MKYAGFGTRVLNFLIDTFVVFILSFVAFRSWNWYVLYYRIESFNFWSFFFGVTFVYYFLLESILGRSVGKWLTYSKVVNKQGLKPNIGQVFIRSLTRIILLDSFFIPFLDKTLHDYVSKTEVVQV